MQTNGAEAFLDQDNNECGGSLWNVAARCGTYGERSVAMASKLSISLTSALTAGDKYGLHLESDG